MNRLLILTALIITSFMAHSQELNLSKLDSSNYFDFWEGKWSGTWDEPNGKKGKAINNISWITGGKVLQENFEVLEGRSKGFIGTSISVFQPRLNRWKQAWADNQGSYFDFVGDFDGNKRIFKTQPVERNGQQFVQRMVFYNLKEDSFTWDWESSQDGGENWILNWRISYERIGE